MVIYIHTILLIFLGGILDYMGIKVNTPPFWIISGIILGLFLTIDILNTPEE